MSFYISISVIEASLWGFNRDEYYHKGKNSGQDTVIGTKNIQSWNGCRRKTLKRSTPSS